MCAIMCWYHYSTESLALIRQSPLEPTRDSRSDYVLKCYSVWYVAHLAMQCLQSVHNNHFQLSGIHDIIWFAFKKPEKKKKSVEISKF